MPHTELLQADTLAGQIYRTMRLYDWPWTWAALMERFGEDTVELVAAIAELGLGGCLRKFEENSTIFYEVH